MSILNVEHPSNNQHSLRHYFVDEAGDEVLFGRGGRVQIGEQGCSRYFILGVLDVADPEKLGNELEKLRSSLLSDPYFQGVPSMQPGAQKTARAFHATDDLPEVRREVFSLLKQHDIGFHAVVRDKQRTLEYVRGRNQVDPTYRYRENESYDFLVRRLFKTLLHKHDTYNVCFARRGRSPRTEALRKALQTAKQRFDEQSGLTTESKLNPYARYSWQCPELQAVDYFLWALQRLYERREDRYVVHLWEQFRLVVDIDDTRNRQYGQYYTRKKPLTLASLPQKENQRI